jgi:hypothetical protein
MSSVRIFKWVIEPERRLMLSVPVGTKFLSVAAQYQQLVIWGEVPQPSGDESPNPCAALAPSREPRVIVVVTTGDEFETEGKDYIGSAILGKQSEGEWYVAHVYEQLRGHADPIDHRNDEDRKQILDNRTEL